MLRNRGHFDIFGSAILARYATYMEAMEMTEEFHVRNVSEDLMEMYLDHCMAKSDMCTCNRCRADVKAFALNAFPSHYVVSDFGDAMTRALALSTQFQADIITALMKGILIVKAHPRHE